MSLSRRSILGLALTAVMVAVVGFVALPRGSQAQTVAPVNAEDGVAIRGVDPVGYFTDGRVVQGDPAIATDWMGARWLFASEEHRAMFVANPAALAPQYGGYCAWAVAEGYTAPVDPEAWKIVDGKLYLNYSAKIQRKWQRDVPGNISRADVNWPKLKR
jgi:hypothetical protein